MRRAVVLVALATACSSTPNQPAAPPASEACAGDDMWACFRARRAECTADTRVWKQVDRFFDGVLVVTYYVSENGLLRRDIGDRVMYTANSDDWMACIDGCAPDGGAACVPFPESLKMTSVFGDQCSYQQPVAGEAWNGMTSVLFRGTCRDHPVQARVVPELQPLRQAFVAAGAIAPGADSFPERGLPVSISTNGSTSVEIEVHDADCSAFDVPASAALYTDDQARRRAAALLPRLQRAQETEQKKQRKELSQQHVAAMEARMLMEAGKLCLGERETYDKDEVQRCFDEKPELLDQLADISQRVSAAMMKTMIEEARNELNERDSIDLPLCRGVIDND